MFRLLPCLCLFLAACTHVESTDTDDPTPRIVSMSPALTEMVVELGAGRFIVGRSPFCSAVDPETPVVGDLLNVHWERLARIRPTHVLVQSTVQTIDPTLQEVAQQRSWSLIVHPLSSADDIRTAMKTLPGQLGLPEIDAGLAVKRAEGFEQMVQEQIPDQPVIPGERWLLLSPMDPPLAWGTSTYLGQIVEQMGAVNALTTDGWTPIGYEDLTRCRADRVVIVSSSEPDPDHAIFTALERLPPGVEVDTLVHPKLNLPAAHLPDIMRSLRQQLVAEDHQ